MAEQQDYDLPWKDILDLQFEEFMAFFFLLPLTPKSTGRLATSKCRRSWRRSR